MLGGPNGKVVEIAAGDAVVLPVGTGHCCLRGSSDFLVVGAYPRGQQFDICRSAPSAEARRRIDELAAPGFDPVGRPWLSM